MPSMTERTGSWAENPRRGREDAKLLAAERIRELRQISYAELRDRADRGDQVEEVDGRSGARLRRTTSISARSRGGEDELAILVRVDEGSLLGRLSPLAEDLVLATPDGELVGEYTVASEGDDPRRLGAPRRRR